MYVQVQSPADEVAAAGGKRELNRETVNHHLLSILLALHWKIHVIFKYIYLIKHRRKASEIIASHLLSDALAMRAV